MQSRERCGHLSSNDVKLQLVQLRHSIVTCVCIHMMRDELESSESHDVPRLLTAGSGISPIIRDWVSCLQELSVSDQIHCLNPVIQLDNREQL